MGQKPGMKDQKGKPNKRKFIKDSKKKDENESSNKKKKALKNERQYHRPHSESVIAAKELWNKLRLKSNTTEDVEKAMTELMQIMNGKFRRVGAFSYKIFQHLFDISLNK